MQNNTQSHMQDTIHINLQILFTLFYVHSRQTQLKSFVLILISNDHVNSKIYYHISLISRNGRSVWGRGGLRIWQYARHFTDIISFDPHNSLLILILFSLSRQHILLAFIFRRRPEPKHLTTSIISSLACWSKPQLSLMQTILIVFQLASRLPQSSQSDT